MKKRTTKKRTGIGIGLVFLFFVWLYFFLRINHRFPPVAETEYPRNQWVKVKNTIEIMVKDMTFMEDAEIRGTKDIPEGVLFEDEMKLIWLRIRARNTGDTAEKYDYGALPMESAGWSNIADPDFLNYIAGESAALTVELQAGEEREFCLPYLLLKTNYHNDEWEELENKKYCLTFSLYPEKKRICCN